MICRHCKVKKVNRPRGLCWACYYTHGVLALYPSTSKYARRGLNGDGHARPLRPTDAEPGSAEKLAVIAERIACGVSSDHPKDRKIRYLPRAAAPGAPHAVVLHGPTWYGRTDFRAPGSYDTESFASPEQR